MTSLVKPCLLENPRLRMSSRRRKYRFFRLFITGQPVNLRFAQLDLVEIHGDEQPSVSSSSGIPAFQPGPIA